MQLVISILNLLGLGGLALFIFFVWKGLRERIANLTALANEQKETLDAVRVRATELDQMRKDYRQGLDDFQELGKRINERRNELVKELEVANQRKDEQLARSKQLELKELELQQQSLALLPQLQERLSASLTTLDTHIRILTDANVSGKHLGPTDLHIMSLHYYQDPRPQDEDWPAWIFPRRTTASTRRPYIIYSVNDKPSDPENTSDTQDPSLTSPEADEPKKD